MKHPAKSDDSKRELRIKGKKSHNQKPGYGTEKGASSSAQKVREDIEPEGQQKRMKEAKGK